MPFSAVQQLVKLRGCFKHKGHTLVDIGQVGGGVVAELNGAIIVEGAALACKRQLNRLSCAGRECFGEKAGMFQVLLDRGLYKTHARGTHPKTALYYHCHHFVHILIKLLHAR